MTTATKKRLTAAQKRVLIAKDALKQVETKIIKARSGVYFCFTQENDDRIENSVNKNSNIQLKKLLPSVQKNCRVCALGSLFLSHVKKFDNFKAIDLDGLTCSPDKISDLLTYFDKDNLDLIESAFEGWYSIGDRYFITYPSDNKRLIVILKNIIRNNGTFVPELNDKGKPY